MRGYCRCRTTFTRDNIYEFEKDQLYSYDNSHLITVEIPKADNPDIFIGVGFTKVSFEYYFEALTKEQLRDYRLTGILEE